VAEPVRGGCIDPVDTEIDGPVNRSNGLPVVLWSPAELPIASADGPTPKAEASNVRVGGTESALFHKSLFLLKNLSPLRREQINKGESIATAEKSLP